MASPYLAYLTFIHYDKGEQTKIGDHQYKMREKKLNRKNGEEEI